MPILGNNTAYVAARAKARKASLMDRTRLRQLIQQSPDQLTVAVADSGYRAEIDLYAGHFTGGDLVEAALTHNLQAEITNILDYATARFVISLRFTPVVSGTTMRRLSFVLS